MKNSTVLWEFSLMLTQVGICIVFTTCTLLPPVGSSLATKGVGHELVVGIPCIRDCFINVLSCRGLLNSLATFLGKIVLNYRRFDGGISQSKHDWVPKKSTLHCCHHACLTVTSSPSPHLRLMFHGIYLQCWLTLTAGLLLVMNFAFFDGSCAHWYI